MRKFGDEFLNVEIDLLTIGVVKDQFWGHIVFWISGDDLSIRRGCFLVEYIVSHKFYPIQFFRVFDLIIKDFFLIKVFEKYFKLLDIIFSYVTAVAALFVVKDHYRHLKVDGFG